MKLFNTLTKQKEEFTPLKDKEVGIYQCGPTVYWRQHIGNMRGMFVGDILWRTLEYLGYSVHFVRNYTDVGHLTSDEDEGEDKMKMGAEREQKSPEEIAKQYSQLFEKDLSALNIRKATDSPVATQHIKEMQEMVQTLLDKGYAYTTDLAVYFDISKAKDYTRLSGQDLAELRSGAGHGAVSDPDKKDSRDFALWFFKAGKHKNALQTWESPFNSSLVENGEGFPGWHIECSAMSKKYLGPHFDIHLGGIEHISVHHTNEIAQSESANDSPFVNYWLHNEHLLVNGQKMSKSEGTSYSLAEIEEKGFDPMDLRFFFLGAQYRSKQNFTWEALESAKQGREHLLNQLRNLESRKGKVDTGFKEKFVSALEDDLNTPVALAVVQELLKSEAPDGDKFVTVLDFDSVLGLNLEATLSEDKLPKEIQDLVAERAQSRAAKDWKRSDEIRDMLEEKGYVVEDAATGQRIYKRNS